MNNRLRMIFADSDNRPLVNVPVTVQFLPIIPTDPAIDFRHYTTDANGEINDDQIPAGYTVLVTSNFVPGEVK